MKTDEESIVVKNVLLEDLDIMVEMALWESIGHCSMEHGTPHHPRKDKNWEYMGIRGDLLCSQCTRHLLIRLAESYLYLHQKEQMPYPIEHLRSELLDKFESPCVVDIKTQRKYHLTAVERAEKDWKKHIDAGIEPDDKNAWLSRRASYYITKDDEEKLSEKTELDGL